MARKEKTIHYIYKTTCLVTNRYYIGMHSTSNLDDGYLGSGKRLRYSIRKYGKENHTREILEFLLNEVELKKRENEIVNSELLNEDLCMNLVLGGGGFTSEYAKICAIKSNDKQRFLRENDPEWVDNYSKNKSEAQKKAYDEGRRKILVPNCIGNKHSKETKKLMSEVKKGKYDGENNPSYGSCWISKNNTTKKIKKEHLDSYLNEGWVKGRKVKSNIDEKILLEIKKLRESGVSYNKLAIKFGIPKTTLIDNLKK